MLVSNRYVRRMSQLDVTEKLRRFRLTAETMPQVYEAGHGKPVLHETALQVSARCVRGAEWAVEGGVVGALQVSARREQYDQLLETVRFVSAAPPAEGSAPRPAPPAPPPALEPAVPTLQLDPAVRAAVLLVPPPLRNAPPDRPRPARSPAQLTGPYSLYTNLITKYYCILIIWNEVRPFSILS